MYTLAAEHFRRLAAESATLITGLIVTDKTVADKRPLFLKHRFIYCDFVSVISCVIGYTLITQFTGMFVLPVVLCLVLLRSAAGQFA